VEAAAALVASLGLALVPYALLLVVPLLRRMSDPLEAARARASACFGALVALLPLAQGVPPPPGLAPPQLEALARDGGFLQQLLDSRNAAPYALPVDLKIKPRKYQREGINWLAFLRRFGLHGILADVRCRAPLVAFGLLAHAAARCRVVVSQLQRSSPAPLGAPHSVRACGRR